MNEEQFRTGEGVEHGGFDYMAEADKTCSIVFAPQFVDRDAFVALLQRIAADAEHLNTAKKLFFRGKTPADMGTSLPSLADSLAVEFDPNNPNDDDINILHGIVGVITEAGEMAEVLLHRIEHGEFDRVNVAEEGGDVLWYLARQLRGLNTNFERIGRMNIDKLHGRHGNAFDVFRDANRNLATERKRLEAAPLFETTDAPALGVGDDAADGIGRVTRRGATLPNVGKSGGAEPPGVERHLKMPVGDCEGMDC